MEIIGLRYFNVFGPRQNPKGEYAAAIPLFLNALLNNISPIIYGDGNQTRDFTFITNAVQGNIKAMFTENINTKGAIFNIAVGEQITLNKLIEFLQKFINTNIQPTYKTERPGDIRDSLADITKAKTILNYQPTIKVEDGIKQTLDWFKKNKMPNYTL
jgi:UDP-N-acetylglucosamine 4-epimerase